MTTDIAMTIFKALKRTRRFIMTQEGSIADDCLTCTSHILMSNLFHKRKMIKDMVNN